MTFKKEDIMPIEGEQEDIYDESGICLKRVLEEIGKLKEELLDERSIFSRKDIIRMFDDLVRNIK